MYNNIDIVKQDKYKDIRYKGFGGAENTGPHFQFNTGPEESFRKDFDEVQKELPKDQIAKMEYDDDHGGY